MWVYIAIFIVVVLVVLLFTGILFYKTKIKARKSVVTVPFMDALYLAFGGKDNIIGCEVEQGRLKIEVNDLDLVNLEGVKALTDKGVFVTGNVIKVLFKEDAELIKQALNK